MSKHSGQSENRVAPQPKSILHVNKWLNGLPGAAREFESADSAINHTELHIRQILGSVPTKSYVQVSPASWTPRAFQFFSTDAENPQAPIETFMRSVAGERQPHAANYLLVVLQTKNVRTGVAEFNMLRFPAAQELDNKLQETLRQRCNAQCFNFYVPADLSRENGVWIPDFLVAVPKAVKPAFRILSQDTVDRSLYEFSTNFAPPSRFTLMQAGMHLRTQQSLSSSKQNTGQPGHNALSRRPTAALHKRNISAVSQTPATASHPTKPKLGSRAGSASGSLLEVDSDCDSKSGSRQSSVAGPLTPLRRVGQVFSVPADASITQSPRASPKLSVSQTMVPGTNQRTSPAATPAIDQGKIPRRKASDLQQGSVRGSTRS